MTIASTNGTQKTINELARLAHIKAGLLEESQTLSASQSALARDLLGTIVTDLQAESITARAVTSQDVTLTAGTRDYTMASSVLDVFGDALYIPAGDSLTAPTSATVVSQITQAQWHTMGAKDSTGNTTMYFPDRVTTPPVVRLWPIPQEAGTVRFLVHRHLADSNVGACTLDLEIYWEGYIIDELAAALAEAKSMPDAKVTRLQRNAVRKKQRALAMSSGRTDNQIYVSHGRRF